MPEILGLDDTNKYGKRAVQLDVIDRTVNLKRALFPPRTYMPDTKMASELQLTLDEAHLHSLLANWDGKDAVSKMTIIASAMSLQPSIPFTVRFGEERERRLAAHPSSALRKIQADLAPLNVLGATMMTVEFDKKGRLHLHGVVATDARWSAVKKVLQGVGGKSTSQAFRNLYQAVVKPPGSLCGWAAYMTKDLIDLPASERASHIYISQSATRLGKAHLPVLKDLVQEKLGIKSDWRGKAAVYSGSGFTVTSSSVSGMRCH